MSFISKYDNIVFCSVRRPTTKARKIGISQKKLCKEIRKQKLEKVDSRGLTKEERSLLYMIKEGGWL